MARGLVRMDRESGFCIWERRRETAVANSESSCRQCSTSWQSEQHQHSVAATANPRVWAVLPILHHQAHLHRHTPRVSIRFPT